MDDIPPSHPIDVDDLETAIREGRHLHRARAYRIKVADETLDFRPIEVVDPMPLGRQILEAAGAQPIDEFSVFALLPHGDTETVLIIDIGKTTTKLLIASSRIPRFTTTLEVGGHALTLAVQKHFGVTEEEAKRVKAEKGLVVGAENEEYLTAMLSTVSVIRDEIIRRLDYWQTRAGSVAAHAPVTRAILVGGNATLRGLPEYLGASLKIPVELGDVFRNFAPRGEWLPPVDYTESLAYATAGVSSRMPAR